MCQEGQCTTTTTMEVGDGVVGCSEGRGAFMGHDPGEEQGGEALEVGVPRAGGEDQVAEGEGPPAAAEDECPLREIVIPISRSKCLWMDTGMGPQNWMEPMPRNYWLK